MQRDGTSTSKLYWESGQPSTKTRVLTAFSFSFPGKAEGVTIEGASGLAANGTPAEEEMEKDVMADDDDDDDEELDLFGEMTEEEKAAAEEKKKVIEAKKAKAKANALKSKSMIIIDVKPWDDTTGTSFATEWSSFLT